MFDILFFNMPIRHHSITPMHMEAEMPPKAYYLG
jgi:hypothetical protein